MEAMGALGMEEVGWDPGTCTTVQLWQGGVVKAGSTEEVGGFLGCRDK